MQLFYCYSSGLRRFFTENGLCWTSRHIKENGYPCWVFTHSSRLDDLYQEYRRKE